MTLKEALDILGLDSDASPKDVKKAFRKLAKRYHPDKNSTSNAEQCFGALMKHTNIGNRLKTYDNKLKRNDRVRNNTKQMTQQAEETKKGKQQIQTKVIEQRTNNIWGYCLITWILAGLLFLDKWYIDQIETLFVILFLPIAFPFVLVIFLTKSLYY